MTDHEKYVFKSLVANKNFRDWVTDPNGNRNHYWQTWIEANQEHEELLRRARNAVLKLKFKEDFLSEDRLEVILTNVISDKVSNSHQRIRNTDQVHLKWWLTAAASIVIAFAIAFVGNSEYSATPSPQVALKTIYNPEGRKSKIRLPDGSIVSLNAESRLIFPSTFSDTLRWVELSGEAYFDVLKNEDRPFIVKTDEVSTMVVGTTLNVRAYEGEDEIRVAVISGKVVVSDQNADSGRDRVLLPGEKLRYSRSSSSYRKCRFNVADEIGWKDGILVFRNTDFNEFVTLLERWYGVSIAVEKKPSRPWSVNGRFINESLEEVLLGVQFSYGISYQIDGKKVRISCEKY